jgi:hypothetical protein
MIKHKKFSGLLKQASLLGLLIFACSAQANTLISLTSSACSTADSKVQGLVYAQTPASIPAGGFPELTSWVTVPLNRAGAVMKPYLDFRYVNPVAPRSSFANHLPYSGISSIGTDGKAWGTAAAEGDASGSLMQYKCVDGFLAAGGMINGFDSPSQAITYGGPQGSLSYLFTGDISNAPSPWISSGTGNLMMQGQFSKPFRFSADNVGGADGGFNIFMRKKTGTPELLNFVISTHRSYALTEDPVLHVDPTTNAVHISTLVADGTQWVTKSSGGTNAAGMRSALLGAESWPDFYRVNISYANMVKVLQAAGKTSKPEDWAVTAATVQYEFTGSTQQSLGFSVRAFELFQSDAPL